jgi:hypothetical protein
MLRQQGGRRAAAAPRSAVMARVVFTANIQRHVDCPELVAAGASVRAVLEQAFAGNAAARGYVLDDQGALRRHMAVFVDGERLRDREGLSDPVGADSTIYVFQALSGG